MHRVGPRLRGSYVLRNDFQDQRLALRQSEIGIVREYVANIREEALMKVRVGYRDLNSRVVRFTGKIERVSKVLSQDFVCQQSHL